MSIHDNAQAAGLPPKYDFNKGVYGTKAVKRHLKKAQHDKCCYCETLFSATSAGTVEHFRPKGRIAGVSDPDRSGYYWLAYDWSNLYFACSICNESYKGSLFPLADENSRARSHTDDIGREDPLLLDPAGPRDPRDHIRFKADVPRWLSEAGRRTIEDIGLDREELCIARRKHLALVDALLRLRNILSGSLADADIVESREVAKLLSEYQNPTSEYWSATEDYIQEFQARK